MIATLRAELESAAANSALKEDVKNELLARSETLAKELAEKDSRIFELMELNDALAKQLGALKAQQVELDSELAEIVSGAAAKEAQRRDAELSTLRHATALQSRIQALEGSTVWRATRPLRRLVDFVKDTRELVRFARHTMTLNPVYDLERLDDGSFLSTGDDPQFDLTSDRDRMPSGWCWMSIDVGEDSAGLIPQLFVFSHGMPEPEQIALSPLRVQSAPTLVRLPENVVRLRLDPDSRPGRIALGRVTFTELGKLQILLDLARDDLRAAWHAYRTTPSFEHFKVKLITDWRGRHPTRLGLDWMQVYELGARPNTITWTSTLRFSVIMPVHKVRADWLREAIRSVTVQTYPDWELICVDDGSCDAAITAVLAAEAKRSPKVRVLARRERRGVSATTNEGLRAATGDFVLFMDHDDVLEPHALARLADGATSQNADMLYGDEIVTGEDTAEYIALQARPAFSYDYYLSHPYLVHPVAVRASLAREIGGLDESLSISQDVDFVLRVLERNPVVTHVPDVLYRWRLVRASAGHRLRDDVLATTAAIKTAHLRRIGFQNAEVRPGRSFNTFVATFHGKPKGRVLAVIPTKNQFALLKQCIDTVSATTRGLELDICVIDHQSTEPEILEYFKDLMEKGAKILEYEGPFNYSALNNAAVKRYGDGYDFFLFLNNDIEAETKGWLEPMIDLAMRPDVGIVGATLLYPDRFVQHAGVIIGMHGAAEHSYKFAPSGDNSGTGSGLHATRDYSAVTAACMLVRADAFRKVDGFDEELTVGFNDTDLCLRVGAAGYRILNSSEAVLLHHESASRGKSAAGHDPHPEDSALFRTRYARILNEGDPFFSPLLSLSDPQLTPRPLAFRALHIGYRTFTQVLPDASATRGGLT